MDSAPPQSEHMETTIDVRRVTVEQRRSTVPLGKHGGVPRPTYDPDVVDLDMEIGQDATETLKPAAQGSFVVALTTKRVGDALCRHLQLLPQALVKCRCRDEAP